MHTISYEKTVPVPAFPERRSEDPRNMNRPDEDYTVLEDVSFVRSRKLILDGINWNIRLGSHWTVLGANGSGKTTLLELLAGYLWPTRGRITVLGRRFGEVDLRELRKEIGWVGSFLQAQIPPNQKPLDLIVSGKFASIGIYEKPADDDYDLAEELARSLGCDRLLDSPYGVLSQGEKQRLLIARALIHRPRLLILDEPCSGLDIVAREQLLNRLEAVGSSPDSPTMILVTHHLQEIMPVFTHALLLRRGQCIAQGEKEAVLRSDLMSETLGIPVDVREEAGRYRTIVERM